MILTAKLQITIADIEHKTWGEILSPIDTAIALLPKKQKDQESLSEAALHLRQVKNAWRGIRQCTTADDMIRLKQRPYSKMLRRLSST